MALENRFTTMFWEDDSDSSASLYHEFINRTWNSSMFKIEEELSSWRQIDARKREGIIRGMIVSNAIKQSIGGVFLPMLNNSIGLDQSARRAMVSMVEARLNGEHSQLSTKIIFNLNPKIVIDKSISDIKEKESLNLLIDYTESVFKSMVGWSAASQIGIPIEGKSVFDQSNLHIWKSCALSTILLDSSEVLPVSLVFLQMEGNPMPEILKGFQSTSTDISMITTFLSTLADTKLNMLPKNLQEEAYEWLDNLVRVELTNMWKISTLESTLNEEEYELVRGFLEYSMTKSMSKLGVFPESKSIEMPKLIEHYLAYNVEEAKRKAKPTKLGWRKGGVKK